MNRNTVFASIAAAAMVATAVPAAAFAKSQGDQPATATTGEKKICKSFAATESRMKTTRLCMTKAEWKKFNANRD
jgi:hypothetical protein